MSSNERAVKNIFRFGVLLSLLLTTYYLLPNIASAQEVDLLWQGDVYTPPFYKGRALWSNGSEITFYAAPHIPSPGGGELNPSQLTYKWWKNSTVLGTVSGVGKNSITFTDSITGRPQEVRVEIMTRDGAILASASEKVSGRPVKLLVYENNPLYGIMFNKEVESVYNTFSREVTFVTIPLFFSTLKRDSTFLSYEWRAGSSGIEKSGSVTYRIPEGVFGSSKIDISASNENRIIQNAEKNFIIQFENQNEGL